MIDTGSTSTAVHPSLVRDLDLQQEGREEGSGSEPEESSVRWVPLYHVRITINRLEAVTSWDPFAIESEYDYPKLFRVIIGRDIFNSCRFTFDVPADRFTLELASAP
jgi:hypothetical protein